MNMTISKTFILELILLIIIKFVLEYGYVNFVSSLYSYAGMTFDLSVDKYIIGWITFIIGYVLLYMKKDLYIFEIYLLLFMIYFLPNIVFYSLSNQNTIYFFALIIPFFLIVLTTVNRKIFTIPSVRNGKVIVLTLSFLTVFLVIGNYFISTGGKMVFSLPEVYAFRDEFEAASSNGFFGYINSWASKIFSVVVFAWALYKNKFFMILISVFMILLLFSLSGHKGVLQSIFLVLFFYMFFKTENRRIVFMLGFLSLIGSVLILTICLDLGMLGSLIIRRLLFVPAHLNFTYFDFFSQNDFVYWSNSVLKYFINYPYEVRPVQVIGAYLGKPDMAANTGFVASGYMHAGYIGIIIYTFIAIVLFNIINDFSKKINKYFVMAIILVPINSLFVSSDMFTVLLTHGLLVAVMVLWMYDDKNYNIKLGGFKYEI